MQSGIEHSAELEIIINIKIIIKTVYIFLEICDKKSLF